VSKPDRRQAWLAAALPWLLLAGFALVAWLLFGEQLRPATPVTVERVVTMRASASAAEAGNRAAGSSENAADPWESHMLFQASGWIEPDPLPIKVTTLIDGVVDTVSVLEGESVEKGQRLVTMVQEDFELDLATAESDLAALKSEAKAHESSIEAARARIETLEKEIAAEHAKRLELEDERNRLERLGENAVAEGEITQARLRVQTHRSRIAAMEASDAELEADLERLLAQREQLAARVGRAETEVARRRLAFDRTTIEAPVDGVVMHLHAVPGQRRMLSMEGELSPTIAILYQPDRLQARIDVPLAEAAQLAVGQPVRIRTNFLPDATFRGEVTRIVGQADLQRNTLQAKVALQDPDPRLRPEMLCRAEFLAPVQPSDESSETTGSGGGGGVTRVDVFVPEAALVDRSDREAVVWTLDVEGRHLRRRSVRLGAEKREGYLAVESGLEPGDRVVVDPSRALAEGQRVEPRISSSLSSNES